MFNCCYIILAPTTRELSVCLMTVLDDLLRARRDKEIQTSSLHLLVDHHLIYLSLTANFGEKD